MLRGLQGSRWYCWCLLLLVFSGLTYGQPQPAADPVAAWAERLQSGDVATKLATLELVASRLQELTAWDAHADTDANSGKRLLSLLVALLADSDGTVSSQATECLKRLEKKWQEPVVDALLPALESQNSMARFLAAEILGYSNDHRAVVTLVKLLADADMYVSGSAACALGNLGATESIAVLANLLDAKTKSPRYARISILQAFAQIGGPKVIAPLLQALQDDEPYVRYEAAKSLGAIADSQVVEPLVSCVLSDTHQPTRAMAAQALVQIGARNPQLNFKPFLAIVSPYLVPRVAALAAWPDPVPHATVTIEGTRISYLHKPMEYSIEIANNGNMPLNGAQLIMPLWYQDYIGSTSPGRWNSVTRLITWELPPILPNNKVKLFIDIRTSHGGRYTQPCKLRWQGKETVANAETEILICGARLLSATYETKDPVSVGDMTTYVISATYYGGYCTNLTLVNILPDEMRYIQAYNEDKTKLNCQVDGQKITFAPIPRLLKKQTVTYYIECMAIQPGNAYNQALWHYDEFSRDMVDIEGTGVMK